MIRPPRNTLVSRWPPELTITPPCIRTFIIKSSWCVFKRIHAPSVGLQRPLSHSISFLSPPLAPYCPWYINCIFFGHFLRGYKEINSKSTFHQDGRGPDEMRRLPLRWGRCDVQSKGPEVQGESFDAFWSTQTRHNLQIVRYREKKKGHVTRKLNT